MREKIYKTLETSNGITIFNSQGIDWSSFTFTHGYTKHIVTSAECLRFYLVSQAYYGDVIYEDILMLVNNIVDPFEIVPGSTIKIPALQDINAFIYSYQT